MLFRYVFSNNNGCCHDDEASLKTLTLAQLDKSYPATAWTQVFTDGSAENAARNGGCRIYIRQPNKPPITIAIPGEDLCSNYRAEAQALLTATETVTQLETRPKKVVLLTDSLSVLQSLASGNPEDYTLRNLIHYKYNKSTSNAEDEDYESYIIHHSNIIKYHWSKALLVT